MLVSDLFPGVTGGNRRYKGRPGKSGHGHGLFFCCFLNILKNQCFTAIPECDCKVKLPLGSL